MEGPRARSVRRTLARIGGVVLLIHALGFASIVPDALMLPPVPRVGACAFYAVFVVVTASMLLGRSSRRLVWAFAVVVAVAAIAAALVAPDSSFVSSERWIYVATDVALAALPAFLGHRVLAGGFVVVGIGATVGIVWPLDGTELGNVLIYLGGLFSVLAVSDYAWRVASMLDDADQRAADARRRELDAGAAARAVADRRRVLHDTVIAGLMAVSMADVGLPDEDVRRAAADGARGLREGTNQW